MKPRFMAEPPLPVRPGSLLKSLSQILTRIRFILWHTLVPFNSRPEEIDSLPEPTVDINESQVKQCQWIFDQAEARRVHLEQKAQSTFGLMIFLVPLLASVFVFIIGRTENTAFHTPVILLLIISSVFLLLGFISAVRGVAVKTIETLFISSVVREDGQFREYNRGFHARGLLYCAAMNQAMNDHIAEYVKGAHILTASAVVILVIAAVPTSVVLSNLSSSPMQTTIVGPVDISSPALMALRDDVSNLKDNFGKLRDSMAAEDDLKLLEEKVASLEAKVREMQK